MLDIGGFVAAFGGAAIRQGVVQGMGFLDDLKSQAGAIRAQRLGSDQAQLRALQLVEAAARDCRHYIMELASNLEVLSPAPAVTYRFDKLAAVESLPRRAFRFDARSKTIGNLEVIDHIVMAAVVESGREIALTKNFLNEIEVLEERLTQAGAEFDSEAVRTQEGGKLVEVCYGFIANVRLGTTVTCRHREGTLHFRMRNLDGLETVDCEFPPHLVTQAKLDELARWWVGEPHRFLDGASNVRRVAAR